MTKQVIKMTMTGGGRFSYEFMGTRWQAIKIAREFASYSYTATVEYDGVMYKG